MDSSPTDKLATTLTVAYLLFLLAFGWQYHTIEETRSAEWDGYVDKAERIRTGDLPADPYRPMLYPLTSAAMGALFGDTFTGARVVSSLFAALFVLTAYLLGRLCCGRGVGLFALTAMIANPHVFRYGLLTSTDMMSAALAVLTVYVALKAGDRPTIASVVKVAACFALAYFTRYTAVSLLPVILAALVLVEGKDDRRRAGLRIAVFVGAAAVFLLPHFFLTTHVFGNPFHNENWRNLALKMYGEYDWAYLDQNPYGGLLPVIFSSPFLFISVSFKELAKFIFVDLIRLGGFGVAGGLLAAATLGGVYAMLPSAGRKRTILLLYPLCYVVLVCVFFYTSPRFMLPILPVCYVASGYLVLSTGAFAGEFRVAGRAVPRSFPVVALFLAFLIAATARELPVFISMHPVQAREAALELQARAGTDVTVVGTCPVLYRYVDYRYVTLKMQDTDASCFDYRQLEQILKEEQADYLLVSKLTMAGLPLNLLQGVDIPPCLELVSSNDDVATYKFIIAGDDRE